ncbi:MAG: hypothetical protein CMJ93_07900 [Planctomycetes bacterium]|nr:hypothetical protein [Planctomycetota bacterium]
MPSISDIARDKHDLLQRYRALLMEDMLEDLRRQAEENAEEELFAWSGEFRSRDEIVQLYNERKKWNRRFVIDTYALAIVLLLATVGLSFAFKFVAPRPNFEKDMSATPQVELIDSQTNQ